MEHSASMQGHGHPGGHPGGMPQGNGIMPPFLVSYSVTRECNLRCKHCYSESSDNVPKDELTTEQAFRLLDEIVSWGPKLLIFDGGEPLKRADFFDLAKHASSRGIRTVIGTNATLIDRNVAQKLKDCGVMAAQISVDGANAKTHDWFRGVEGSFEKAMQGAKACREVGLPFQFGATIRKGTIKELPRLLDMAVETGAIAAELFDLVQVQRVKEEIPDEILSVEERKEIMGWLARKQEDYPIVIRTPGCTMYPITLQSAGIVPKHFPKENLMRIPYYNRGCAAGMPNGYVTILPNGNVIPCMLLQTVVGNVKNDSLKKIWETSPILLELRDRSKLKGKCKGCEHDKTCSGCRGRAYEQTGDYFAEDPGCYLK